MTPTSQLLRVGDAEVDLLSGEVSRRGTTVRVAPKTAQVLAALCRRAGETVPKEQLIAEVWSETFVTDDGLWHSIAELRRVFDDDARSPRVIETLPRRGYRLLARVEPAEPLDAGGRESVARRWPLTALWVMLVVVLGGGGFWAWSRAVERSPSLDRLLEEARAELEGRTSGHNERAVELYEEAVDRAPDSAAAHAGLANAYVARLNYSTERWWDERALESARSATQLDPSLAEGFVALGRALAASGRRGEAGAAFRRALALDPDHLAALTRLARVELDRGSLAAAARLLLRATDLAPGDASALTHLGETYRLLGMNEAAREALTAGSEAGGRETPLANTWEQALVDLGEGKLDAARLRLEARAASFRRVPSFWLRLGDLELIAGRQQDALKRFSEVLPSPHGWDLRPALSWELAGGELPSRDWLMREYLRLERETAAEEHSASPVAFAAVRLAVGRIDEALSSVEEAIERGYRDRVWLSVDPRLARLAKEPRFIALLKRVDRLAEQERSALCGPAGSPPGPAKLPHSRTCPGTTAARDARDRGAAPA